MYPTQNNTQEGPIVKIAGEDLTDKEGRLVKLNSDGEALLPTAATDICPFILGAGAEENAEVYLIPITGIRNLRALLKGTCDPGDQLCLADPSVSADKGKIRALPESADTYRCFAIAEESGVDAQRLKFRYTGPESVVVSG
jgi:hypothetical protein